MGTVEMFRLKFEAVVAGQAGIVFVRNEPHASEPPATSKYRPAVRPFTINSALPVPNLTVPPVPVPTVNPAAFVQPDGPELA